MSALLQIEGLTKRFGTLTANDAVSMTIAPGSIHALLGENGAGKSTLVKMIYGLMRPDAGHMRLGQTAFAPRSPKAARAAGIGMVFQHFALFENMTVAENVALGLDHPRPPRRLARQIREVAALYGLAIEPQDRIADLSSGERQRVELLRNLLRDHKLLILDEPTSVLTPQETEGLFATLRRLASEGVSILYISHKLSEIQALCDTATILRQGQVVASCDPRRETRQSLAEAMIGKRLPEARPRMGRPGEILFEARGISLKSAGREGGGRALSNISFALREGEILGIGGVAGNGQSSLVAALSGEVPLSGGSLQFRGQDITRLGINARRRLGILSAPEDRLGHAAVPQMSLAQNALLTARVRERLDVSGFLRLNVASHFARAVIERFDVRCKGPDQMAGELSGGNLQKFLIGREVMQRPRLLIVNQPSWGVDAAAAIRNALRAAADAGTGVIVISQDLDELAEMVDQVAIISGGRLSPPADAGAITIEEIGRLMEGGHDAA